MEVDDSGSDSEPPSPTKSDVSEAKKEHKCNYPGCSAAFGRPYRLEQHIRVHTGQRPYVCSKEGCGKSYTRTAHLKRHEEKCHQTSFVPKLKCTDPNCKETFACELSLRRHFSRFHENRKFVCDHCKARFKKHQNLKIHLFEHTGIKPFKCTEEGCDKSFILPSKLKAHMKTHSGYTCTFEACKERFNSWTLLRQHKAREHAKTYNCTQCDHIASSKALLTYHLRTHEKEREVFHCPYDNCDRQYLYEKNLSEHIKAFHEERFKCTFENCQKTLQSYKAFKKHTSSHKTGLKPRKPSTKPRATRKDKGVAKKSMVSNLTGLALPSEMEKELIHSI